MSDLRSLASTAYIWGSALVGSAQLRQNTTRPDDPFVGRSASSAGAPLNNIGHQRKLSDPSYNVGVAPNVDTLYSLAWLDLDGGPYVLETPDFGDRYYAFQIGYADTECDQCPGRRTHGAQLPPLLLHAQSFEGQIPPGMLSIPSRTRYLMIAGRILVEPGNPDDLAAVHRLQDEIRLRPLDRWANTEPGVNPVTDQRPLPTQATVDDPDLVFLHALGVVLGEGVVRPSDRDLVASFEALGLRPEGGFDPAWGAGDRASVVAGLRDGAALVDEKIGRLGAAANGWSVNLDGPRFGDDYLLRAAVAKNQIYVVPAVEAVYPVATVDGDGVPLDGRNAYRLTFTSTPPAQAFWSLTVYGIPGPLVANPLNRYAVGDRTPGIVVGDDGATTIVLQHEAPPGDTIANWLPTPAGPFTLMMRLYWPQPSVLEGEWMPPPIERQSLDSNERPAMGAAS